jgi:RNA polymerase sigma-70 factor, ECF subfamily
LGESSLFRQNVKRISGCREDFATSTLKRWRVPPSTLAEEGHMTTAPDLPVLGLPIAPRPAAAPLAPAPRQPLRVVPELPADGEVVDFDEALRRAAPRLQRYAVRRLHDPHEAEEVVQEALLRAFQHREKLTTEDDLMAWVTVVTGRLVIDRLRVRGRAITVAELPAGARTGRDTAEVVVARDEARIALDALEAMPARQAAVLWAREVEGLSYDDIGERFGLSEPSVRSVLHRARKTLRRESSLRGGSMPAIALVALAPWLRGLRAAGKLRVAARRVATAAAVTATGLAAVSAVPYVVPAKPAHTTPLTEPALSVRPVAHAAARHAARAANHAGTPVRKASAVAVPTGSAHQHATVMPHLPQACRVPTGQGNASVGCATHRAHMLFVKLPVPVNGQKWVGVSTDEVDCSPVPTNPVAQCDTHGGNS